MVNLKQDEKWMKLALEQAQKAMAMGEVPVGAVIIRNEKIVSCAHNLRETQNLATAHAEILAIKDACTTLKSKHLSDCTLYVTLEPCPMCAGALIGARIGRIVFGAKDARAGACGSLVDLWAYPLEAKPKITSGILEEECLFLLRDFFSARRKNNFIKNDKQRS